MKKRSLNLYPLRIQSVMGLTSLVALLVALTPIPASAYSGAISSADFAILGTGNWIVEGPTTLSWSVTQNADQSWHYAYSFAHPKGETSHFILETSTNFTEADLLHATGQFGEVDLGWHSVGSGNPSMPEALYGIKFDESDGLTTTFAFDSFRVPVWGDFYSKNGRAGGHGQNAAWNAGFTVGDLDPDAPAQDGSIDHHLLVPDTFSTENTPEVPEPATWILMGSALAGSWLLQRKRRRG